LIGRFLDRRRDGVGTAKGVERRHDEFGPPGIQKEQESSGASSPWAWTIPIAWRACCFLGRRISGIPTGFQSSGAGIYNQLTQERVMQYRKPVTSPTITFVTFVGDVDAEKVRQQLGDLFKPYPEIA
jgi:hypothetical protein